VCVCVYTWKTCWCGVLFSPAALLNGISLVLPVKCLGLWGAQLVNTEYRETLVVYLGIVGEHEVG